MPNLSNLSHNKNDVEQKKKWAQSLFGVQDMPALSAPIDSLEVCVCVCMNVCVCERERGNVCVCVCMSVCV